MQDVIGEQAKFLFNFKKNVDNLLHDSSHVSLNKIRNKLFLNIIIGPELFFESFSRMPH